MLSLKVVREMFEGEDEEIRLAMIAQPILNAIIEDRVFIEQQEMRGYLYLVFGIAKAVINHEESHAT